MAAVNVEIFLIWYTKRNVCRTITRQTSKRSTFMNWRHCLSAVDSANRNLSECLSTKTIKLCRWLIKKKFGWDFSINYTFSIRVLPTRHLLTLKSWSGKWYKAWKMYYYQVLDSHFYFIFYLNVLSSSFRLVTFTL